MYSFYNSLSATRKLSWYYTKKHRILKRQKTNDIVLDASTLNEVQDNEVLKIMIIIILLMMIKMLTKLMQPVIAMVPFLVKILPNVLNLRMRKIVKGVSQDLEIVATLSNFTISKLLLILRDEVDTTYKRQHIPFCGKDSGRKQEQ